MSNANSHDAGKHVQVALAVDIVQPLHVALT